MRDLLWPRNLYRLSSPWYGRSHLLAERLEELYNGKTFGDLRLRENAPRLLINATDLTLGTTFHFSQQQFSLICSDLDRVPLSFAVAASSAVPILLTPMVLKNHANDCPLAPQRFEADVDNYRARLMAQDYRSYLDSRRRAYIHLVDGGLSDNLGVRGLLDEATALGGLGKMSRGLLQGTIRKMVLIAVNSERDPAERIEQSNEVPSNFQVMDSLIFGAGARATQETLAMMEDSAQQWAEEVRRSAGQSASPFAEGAEIYVISVNLRDAPERKEGLVPLLQIPTAFSIPGQDVRRLEDAGRDALRASPRFQQLKAALQARGPRSPPRDPRGAVLLPNRLASSHKENPMPLSPALTALPRKTAVTRAAAASALLCLLPLAAAAKTFVYCSEGSPENFTPALNTTGTSFDAAGPVYDKLVQFARGTTQVEPGLAQSWEVSPDGRTVTFKLRRGVNFHSGVNGFKPTRPFNADDVLFSFDRQWKPEHPYAKVSGGKYDYFADMDMPKLLEAIEKVDDLHRALQAQGSQRHHPRQPGDGLHLHPLRRIRRLPGQGQQEGAVRPGAGGHGGFLLCHLPEGRGDPLQGPTRRTGAKRAQVDDLVFAITPDPTARYSKLKKGECHFAVHAAAGGPAGDEEGPGAQGHRPGRSQHRLLGLQRGEAAL